MPHGAGQVVGVKSDGPTPGVGILGQGHPRVLGQGKNPWWIMVE